jgi:prophage antirepressor-like protein
MKEIAKVFQDKPVRMLVQRGDPWWVLKDVCDVLGLTTPARVAERLEEDEVSLAHFVDSIGRSQETSIINESGLYSVIIRSDKPEAKAFRKWITSEVLPSIRKTGQYSVSTEARKESSAARSALCRQWQEHGADKFYHYINLTKSEYDAVFGDRAKKKADMNKEELGVLMVFEAVEYLKLVKNPQVSGYRQLDDSLRTTAKQLPLFTTMRLEGATA